MKLIDNAGKWYRMFSVQAMVLASAVLGAWQVLPDDLKATLPPWVATAAAITLLALGIAGRLVDQGAITQPPSDAP